MENNPLVSIIIPIYNNEKTIPDCFNSVFESDYDNYEVIVIDDHSNDNSSLIAGKFPCKVISAKENYGPAEARNMGVEVAAGSILFFLDADIIIEKNTLGEIVSTFQDRKDIDALFCSYKIDPFHSNFFSQYKNILHHYTHQNSNEDAATFCGGFGAIKRDVFLAFNGFDRDYRSLEDIEFGYRLHQAGKKIFLNRKIQLTHCKRYTLKSMIKSDVENRAIPWTKIMLQKKIWKNDLNTKINNILSVPIAYLILVHLALIFYYDWGRYTMALLIVLFLFLNLQFHNFIYHEKGLLFTIKVIVMSWFNYLYSGVGLIMGVLVFWKESWRKS